MRIKTPKFDNKKDLFDYLTKNKESLIKQKKSMPIFGEVSTIGVSKIKTKATTIKNEHGEEVENEDVIRVKVVANTANWIDSHMDMLLPGCWDKSIAERKAWIPHLHDHIHKLDAKVGDVIDIMGTTLSYSELGLDGSGSTESLVFITDIMKSFNEQIFNQYKAGKINQHSIGLQYVKLDLAINDEDSEKELEFWDKYYPQVINKDVADERGFFWVVQEIKLLENSAVLFGSNELTPTLETESKITKEKESGETTPEGKSKEEEEQEGWDVKAYL